MLNGKNSPIFAKNSGKNLRISKNSSTFALGKQKQLTIKTITTMKKDFSNTPVSEIAKMAYTLACENAEQVVNTVNDHGDNDPRYEREERTQHWECMIMTKLCGIPIFIDALFICPTTSEIFEKERCHYFRIEYRGTTPEQDDIFNAYGNALYYELQKIVGLDCDLCVE